MKVMLDWIWFGPWWTPLVGGVYAAVLFNLIFGSLIAALNASKRGNYHRSSRGTE